MGGGVRKRVDNLSLIGRSAKNERAVMESQRHSFACASNFLEL